MVSTKEEIIAVGICFILFLLVFSSGCIKEEVKLIDTDWDGIPDNEDDYPTDKLL